MTIDGSSSTEESQTQRESDSSWKDTAVCSNFPDIKLKRTMNYKALNITAVSQCCAD